MSRRVCLKLKRNFNRKQISLFNSKEKILNTHTDPSTHIYGFAVCVHLCCIHICVCVSVCVHSYKVFRKA